MKAFMQGKPGAPNVELRAALPGTCLWVALSSQAGGEACSCASWTSEVDGFVREARVLLQLRCLLEIPLCVCWEELVKGSRVVSRGWADRSHGAPFLPP